MPHGLGAKYRKRRTFVRRWLVVATRLSVIIIPAKCDGRHRLPESVNKGAMCIPSGSSDVLLDIRGHREPRGMR